MKKNLDDLTVLEQQTVKEYIKSRSPKLGIKTIVFDADGGYVVFENPR